MHVQGVATTTIDEVLAASATSKSQFYQHFDDKSELVYEVITVRADEILSWQRLRLEKVDSLLERKKAMLARLRQHLRLKAMLELWLYIHVPATFALIAALTAHIVSVFFYW